MDSSWLPLGFCLPGGAPAGNVIYSGAGWQILGVRGGGRALVVNESLKQRWAGTGLLEVGVLSQFEFGDDCYWSLISISDQRLCPVDGSRSPRTRDEALAFAQAMRATRTIDAESPLHDALYVEKITRLLPTYGVTSPMPDDILLGCWLTGGLRVSVKGSRRLDQALSWLPGPQLYEIVEVAGLHNSTPADPVEQMAAPRSKSDERDGRTSERLSRANISDDFDLPGRAQLSTFLNEHVIDVVTHRDRYRQLGVGFPGAFVLHGPPGCGKTYAVERLVEYLDWPCFSIEASTVASPYIHETSRKIAEVFDKAMSQAPSVVIIDEMEAFVAHRDGEQGHRVEEVAEFLRRIPEATKNDVLVVAMTNMIDAIDPAILRRGRFDHVVAVGWPSEREVKAALDCMLAEIPKEPDVDTSLLAAQLIGRPLSDVAYVAREGARLAARSNRERLDQASLTTAAEATPDRTEETTTRRRIGLV